MESSDWSVMDGHNMTVKCILPVGQKRSPQDSAVMQSSDYSVKVITGQ